MIESLLSCLEYFELFNCENVGDDIFGKDWVVNLKAEFFWQFGVSWLSCEVGVSLINWEFWLWILLRFWFETKLLTK